MNELTSISIQVNGRDRAVDSEATIADLLAELQLVPTQVAVEINEQLVPRGGFAERQLQANDRIEIVTLAGGG